MNEITKELLRLVADIQEGDKLKGAYNIREDCSSVARASTENIQIISKEDAPGIEIRVAPGTLKEVAYIPACVTHENVDDLVYNDFYIGEGADVKVVAGCGIHTTTGEAARHNGIHRFFLAKNSHVLYQEKHIGIGSVAGNRSIDPVTEIFLEEGAVLEMETSQLSGVDSTDRKTTATLGAGASLIVHEHLLTEGEQTAKTAFTVEIQGDDASVDLISRSVAKGNSTQEYFSNLIGNARCTGHSECDAILSENGKVSAAPSLSAFHPDASLIHEAAIGKIAGEQLLKLQTLGLTVEEAEARIIAGFLKN